MLRVPSDRHPYGFGQGFEYGLYLVVLIGSLGLDVDVGSRSISKGFEEVHEHLSGHLSDHLSFEFRFPNQPASSAKVNGYTSQAVVHGKAVAVTVDTEFVAQGLFEGFTQSNGSILYGMIDRKSVV